MSVNGTQVFNGAVNDSSTVRSGPPSILNHLWSYELDENTTGDLTVSVAVTGGELCLGLTHNNLNKTKPVPDSWFEEQADQVGSAENQAYLASQIGQALLDAEQAGLYDKLVAGTALESDSADVLAANANGPRSAEEFIPLNDVRSDLQINNDANHPQIVEADQDEEKAGWWPILQDGDTLTYTWTFDPDAEAF
jgi:hypothetical protein